MPLVARDWERITFLARLGTKKRLSKVNLNISVILRGLIEEKYPEEDIEELQPKI